MSSGSELIERHVAAKKRLKLVRILGPLILVLVVVGGIWSIVNLFKDMDMDVLTTSLETEAERVMPRVQEHVVNAFTELQPEVLAAFTAEQRAVGPRLSKRFDDEIAAIKRVLGDSLKNQLATALDSAQKRQRKALVKEFPQLKEDVEAQNKILYAAKAGAEEWAQAQMTGALNAHISAMMDIRKTLNQKFLEGSGEEPREVMLTYLELMADTVGGDSTIIGDNPVPAPRGKGKKRGGGK